MGFLNLGVIMLIVILSVAVGRAERGQYTRLHPHVLNVLGMQMRSHLHMQSSHVPHIAWLINKQMNHMAN